MNQKHMINTDFESKISFMKSVKIEMDNHFDKVIDNFINSSIEKYKNELIDKYVGKTCKVIIYDDCQITGKVTDVKVTYDDFYYAHLIVDVKLETWTPSIETDTEDGWFRDVSIESVTL